MGQEDLLHKQTANFLLVNANQLNNIRGWSYMPFGEARTKKTGGLLKKKGTKKGFPDFWIRKDNPDVQISYPVRSVIYNIYLEAKVEDRGQTPEQKEFEKSCGVNEHYYVYRSMDELIDILKKENIY